MARFLCPGHIENGPDQCYARKGNRSIVHSGYANPPGVCGRLHPLKFARHEGMQTVRHWSAEMMPRWIAVVAASVRSETSSFSMTLFTWFLTVFWLMFKTLPICLFVNPFASTLR